MNSDDDSKPKSPVPESVSSTPATKGSSVVFSYDDDGESENVQDHQDQGFKYIYIYIHITVENCLGHGKVFVCCSMFFLGV